MTSFIIQEFRSKTAAREYYECICTKATRLHSFILTSGFGSSQPDNLGSSLTQQAQRLVSDLTSCCQAAALIHASNASLEDAFCSI